MMFVPELPFLTALRRIWTEDKLSRSGFEWNWIVNSWPKNTIFREKAALAAGMVSPLLRYPSVFTRLKHATFLRVTLPGLLFEIAQCGARFSPGHQQGLVSSQMRERWHVCK